MLNEDKAWIEYKEKFSEVYDDSNYSSPLQSFVMRASHKLVEKAYDKKMHFSQVLEVGAGTGAHFPFVRHSYDKYTISDHDSKTLDVAIKKITATNNSKVNFEMQVGDKLDYPDGTFDRLISTHVLEHIYQPHLVIKEWRRVLKDGGVISILIPTDPGVAWRLGRHLGPRRAAIKRGIAYDYAMAREHVNSCNNLVALLNHYFPKSIEDWWPFTVASIDLNLFYSFNATVSKVK